MCGHRPQTGRHCTECGAERVAPVAPPADPWAGRVIAGRYRIIEPIGQGGMGRVYRAVQLTLDREVALKVIAPGALASDDIGSRFLSEARAASQLSHPNVIQIIDFGVTSLEDGHELFLVMELLRGRDLADVLAKEGPLPLPRIADILCQTLGALAEAHRVGITHRDVKPENIVLEPRRGGGDHVKLIDFGLARSAGAPRITKTGALTGTPNYMAPEQIEGSTLGPSADLYAVGIVLFEMLAGRPPFDHEVPLKIIGGHLWAPRPDPRHVAPDRHIPAALADVCLRAIAVDPKSRHADADELARAITDAAKATNDVLDTAAAAPELRPGREGSPSPVPPSSQPANVDVSTSGPTAPADESLGSRDALDEVGALGVAIAATLAGRLRFEEARGILTDVLEGLAPEDPSRARVLEQLASVADGQGKTAEASGWRAAARRVRDGRGPKSAGCYSVMASATPSSGRSVARGSGGTSEPAPLRTRRAS